VALLFILDFLLKFRYSYVTMRLYKFLKIGSIVGTVVALMLAIFLIVYPFLSQTKLDTNAVKLEVHTYENEVTTEEVKGIANELPTTPSENRIIIPKISVDALITEGENESALEFGMWHRPNSSTPEKGGNTVITGHRVKYTKGPNTFYHLDKLTEGDIITTYWQGKEYSYMVFETLEVLPDKIEIELNTINPIITLYTCTPAGTADRRLVIKAKLIS